MSGWEITEGDWERPVDRASQSVLIVDDDPSIRSMLGFLFEDEGFSVREAADGVEALAALEDDAPDVLVLDLMMPEVDGHEVLRVRRERALAPDTRVLILTAKTDPSDAVWCWELGADEYVTKPVDPDAFVREVHILLRRTADEMRARREEGLAEARRLDAMEKAFSPKRRLGR